MGIANLALRFVLELVGVVALGYWGFGAADAGFARIAIGIGAPLALVLTWAVVIAPKARNPLPQRTRNLIGTGLLLIAAAALALAGQPLAAAFGALVIVNQVLLIAFDADASAASGWATGRGQ